MLGSLGTGTRYCYSSTPWTDVGHTNLAADACLLKYSRPGQDHSAQHKHTCRMPSVLLGAAPNPYLCDTQPTKQTAIMMCGKLADKRRPTLFL